MLGIVALSWIGPVEVHTSYSLQLAKQCKGSSARALRDTQANRIYIYIYIYRYMSKMHTSEIYLSKTQINCNQMRFNYIDTFPFEFSLVSFLNTAGAWSARAKRSCGGVM